MENRTGEHVPKTTFVSTLLDDLASIEKRLAKYTCLLTPEERSQTTKMRIGGEKISELIIAIAERHEFSLPNVTPEDIRRDLEVLERLAPLQHAVERIARLLGDTMLEAGSEAWWATLAYYSALNSMARTEPKLREELSPAIEFLATGRRRKANGQAPTQ